MPNRAQRMPYGAYRVPYGAYRVPYEAERESRTQPFTVACKPIRTIGIQRESGCVASVSWLSCILR